jgi:microcystin degradation protein MlrC
VRHEPEPIASEVASPLARTRLVPGTYTVCLTSGARLPVCMAHRQCPGQVQPARSLLQTVRASAAASARVVTLSLVKTLCTWFLTV